MKGKDKMLTGKEDLLQSLIEAFLLEKGTMIFYSEASDKALDHHAKQTFKNLSKWEKKHMDFIEYLYLSINESREFKSFEEFQSKTAAPLTEAGIPVEKLENKIEKYSVTNEMGALTLAMEIEGKAYNLYNRLSKNAEDSNARIVFSDMKDQEIKHINYLKRLRINLADVYK